MEWLTKDDSQTQVLNLIIRNYPITCCFISIFIPNEKLKWNI